MGVRLIVGQGEADSVAMYDSVTGWAFGPVFSSEDEAERFIAWLPLDARTYEGNGLEVMYARWIQAGRP